MQMYKVFAWISVNFPILGNLLMLVAGGLDLLRDKTAKSRAPKLVQTYQAGLGMFIGGLVLTAVLAFLARRNGQALM